MNDKQRAFIKAAVAFVQRDDEGDDAYLALLALRKYFKALGPDGVAALCEEKTCKWDGRGIRYKTGCGVEEWSGLAHDYCPYCGGKVEVVR